jgi:hypothetical protein
MIRGHRPRIDGESATTIAEPPTRHRNKRTGTRTETRCIEAFRTDIGTRTRNAALDVHLRFPVDSVGTTDNIHEQGLHGVES